MSFPRLVFAIALVALTAFLSLGDRAPGVRPIDRILKKIKKDENGCWLWFNTRTATGYGRVGIGNKRFALVHRVTYEHFVGPVPEGLQLDHLCRVKNCCNPKHLEPVTAMENSRRAIGAPSSDQNTCPYGHPWTTESTYINKRGYKQCRVCDKERHRKPRIVFPVVGLLIVILAGCNKQANEPVHMQMSSVTMTSTTTIATTTTTTTTVRRSQTAGVRHILASRPLRRTPATPPSLAAVMACIKAHESGNYTEHSHLGSGSGAYQYIPGTWQTWSARAGYGGYQYAYQAPPAVQDAVTVYVLTHGGAGNWSNRYGYDPCTQGMGG